MKRLWAWLLALALLVGCAPAQRHDGKTHLLCTTYPVYLFTTALTQNADDVAVELLVDQQVSCLHDYTLTVADMRAIERADVIIMSGAGLEAFMADALAQSDATVIDCSAGIDLLPSSDHHHHDGDEDGPEHEDDPHIWMDPARAAQMLENIAGGLARATGRGYDEALARTAGRVLALKRPLATPGAALIPFHDGFQYFADAYGLELLKSIEEEEGAEASAKELAELIALVRDNDIPAIFVEKNGSRRSADVIARETGCKVYELDMVMSGQGTGIEPYLEAMEQNLSAVEEAFS